MQNQLIVQNDNHDLQTALAGFFLNQSKTTQEVYVHAAKEFFSFLSAQFSELRSTTEIRRTHIIRFRSSLEDRALANKTILKKMSAISSMCKYLAEEGLIDKDITYGIKRPRSVNSKETADLKEQDVQRIFNAIDDDSFYGPAHKAMLAVGFYTGLRAATIRTLKVKHVAKIEGHCLLTNLRIKGDKVHEVVLPPMASEYLNRHLAHLENLGFEMHAEHYLFPSLKTRKDQAMSHVGFYKIFKSALKKAGIEMPNARRFSTHSMRATVASHLLNERGAKLEDVQDLLGHSSPSTTRLYDKRKKNHHKSPAYLIQY